MLSKILRLVYSFINRKFGFQFLVYELYLKKLLYLSENFQCRDLDNIRCFSESLKFRVLTFSLKCGPDWVFILKL